MQKDDMEIITNAEHVVEPQERITPCYLTKYEKARIIGARAVQISRNSPVLIKVD
jgi:DNA-directed RNA polymerase I, II, and III subunit RPABC2